MASVMGLDCLAEESLIPEDPKDRVGPGIADLFDRDLRGMPRADDEVRDRRVQVRFS